MSLSCKQCGGDVVTAITAGIRLYQHAVKGIDHGPLPTESPTPRSQESRVPPTRPRPDEASGRSLGLTAPETAFPEVPGS